jgi:hypothetical protein
MEFLAKSTLLGTLEVLEVYIQYNGARLLACKNEASKIFLALWVDEEDHYDLWLYMLVSLDRLQAIRTGEISLREAFSEAETHSLYQLTYLYSTSEWSTREIALEDLDQDCLPLEDAYLECDPETLPTVNSQRIIKNAISRSREFINLVLYPTSERHPNEFPALGLGRILAAFQSLINELSAFKHIASGINLKEIIKKSELNTRVFTQSSFQIELASTFFEADLFGNSIVGDATEQIFDLIAIGSNIDNLQNSILKGNKKIAKRYEEFLESLDTTGTGIKIEWGSPTINRGGSIEANLRSIHKTLEVIKRIDSLEIKQINVLGNLFKVDSKGWKFGITDHENNQHYKGNILEEAKADASTATIGRIYRALVREVPEISPTTNEVKTKYELLDLEPYEGSNEQLELLEN